MASSSSTRVKPWLVESGELIGRAMTTAQRSMGIRRVVTGARDAQGQTDYQTTTTRQPAVRQHHQTAIENETVGGETDGRRQVAVQLQSGVIKLLQAGGRSRARWQPLT